MEKIVCVVGSDARKALMEQGAKLVKEQTDINGVVVSYFEVAHSHAFSILNSFPGATLVPESYVRTFNKEVSSDGQA